MKLIILHGSGLAAISNKLSAIKASFNPLEITEINCKELDLGQCLASVSTPQLFSEKRLVILENLDFASDLSTLSQDPNLTLVLKFSKGLPRLSKILKTTAIFNPQIILLDERAETNIFPFLDLLAEKKSESFRQLELYLNEWGGQYILTMIFYMLRRLITPLDNLPVFIVRKIGMQKKNFTLGNITNLYKSAIETDFKIKSGFLEEKLGLTLLVQKIINS